MKDEQADTRVYYALGSVSLWLPVFSRYQINPPSPGMIMVSAGLWTTWFNLVSQNHYQNGLEATSRTLESKRVGPLISKVLSRCSTLTGQPLFFFIESIKFKCLPLWNINNDIDGLNSEYKNFVGRLHIGLCWNIHQKKWR